MRRLLFPLAAGVLLMVGCGVGDSADVRKAKHGLAELAKVRALDEQFGGEVGISAWNGIAVARLCAADGATLRRDLIAVLAALGQRVPRLWLQ